MENGKGTPELLAPAGSLDAFKAALAAGADAVYCGTGRFNARRNAENLGLGELAEACRMAHLAGARVYVAVNILISSDELPDALGLVRDCAEAGADAFIVQDWGLISLARQLWPGLELHLSTQANVHDPWGVRFAAAQGCSRVTLSRELSLPEIAACSGLGVETEAFGHGAICVCYSGECLLSSSQRGRSANRGLCRQPCRLPYRMLDDAGRDLSRAPGTRLLSPKDMCAIGDLGALAAAGCSSVKIEGRMKAPDYVATVTGAYRRALDRLAAGDGEGPGEEEARALSRAFNRGFTDAYLRGESGDGMMSYERGNNRGQLAGSLARAEGARCQVALTEPVGKGDLLELRNPARFEDYVTVPAPCDAPAGALLDVRLPRPMPEGCPARVIRSEAAMAEARAYASREWPRKRPVRVGVTARAGLPFRVELTALGPGGRAASGAAEGRPVEVARTRAVGAEDLREHVGRLGSTPFEAAAWDVELDEGVGIGFSEVHAVRAKAVERLEEALLEPWAERGRSLAEAPFSVDPRPLRRPRATGRPRVAALVSSPAAARAALEAGADEVMAMADDLVLGPGSSGRADLAEGGGAWPDGVAPVFPEVSRLADIERLAPLMREGAEVAAGTAGWLALALERGAGPWLWQTVPVHNHAALQALADAGARGAWLSPELDLLEIGRLAASSPVPLGIVVSGHQRTMTCEHCLLQAMGPCRRECGGCPRRRGRVVVRDEFSRPSLVTSDALGRSRLWEAVPLDATPQMPELLASGVTRFMADCLLLGAADAAASVRRARRALDAALAGRAPAPRAQGASSGHLFERVG